MSTRGKLMNLWLILTIILSICFVVFAFFAIRAAIEAYKKEGKLSLSNLLAILALIIGIIPITLSFSKIEDPPATPTVTVSATNTAIAAFTPIVETATLPIVGLEDLFIPISKYANDSIQNILRDFPTGEISFKRVKFFIPETQNKVSTRCEQNPNWEERFEIPTGPISNPESIYILLAAGYSHADLQNKLIGEIELVFDKNEPVAYELRLGQNIREWRLEGANVAMNLDGGVEGTSVQEVYRGSLAVNSDELGIIDMLKLDIPEDHQISSLQKIIITDVTMQELRSNNPCFHFVGITVRARN